MGRVPQVKGERLCSTYEIREYCRCYAHLRGRGFRDSELPSHRPWRQNELTEKSNYRTKRLQRSDDRIRRPARKVAQILPSIRARTIAVSPSGRSDLSFVESVVGASLAQQDFMGPFLDNLSVLEDDDSVRVYY